MALLVCHWFCLVVLNFVFFKNFQLNVNVGNVDIENNSRTYPSVATLVHNEGEGVAFNLRNLTRASPMRSILNPNE